VEIPTAVWAKNNEKQLVAAGTARSVPPKKKTRQIYFALLAVSVAFVVSAALTFLYRSFLVVNEKHPTPSVLQAASVSHTTRHEAVCSTV
jgi:hypothetical protein